MNITKTVNGNDLVVSIVGRLDTSTATFFEDFISENIIGINNLTLDFKEVDYISSAGLRVILSTQKKMTQVGTMKVINVCDLIMEVFEITGFADILTIE